MSELRGQSRAKKRSGTAGVDQDSSWNTSNQSLKTDGSGGGGTIGGRLGQSQTHLFIRLLLIFSGGITVIIV